jgi:hypothetical protein
MITSASRAVSSAFVAVVCLGAGTLAQDVTPAKLTAPNSRGRSNLVAMAVFALTSPEGSADVGLSPDQVERVRELSKALYAVQTPKLKALELLSENEHIEKAAPIWDAFARDGEKGLAEILTPEQQRRTRQIVLHVSRASAFRIPEVEEALKLTDSQKTEIARIHAETLAKARELASQKGNFEARQAVFRDTFVKQDAAILAVLDGNQRALWSRILGKPYQNSSSFERHTPPPGR